MKSAFILFVVFSANCLAINCASGQSTGPAADTNGIRLIQDKRIGRLIEKHVAINQEKKGRNGYRVQLFFCSSKKQAMEVNASFIETYPGQESYVIYDVPYFKVRVGDFNTRMKAAKLQKQLTEDFPGSFIVQDIIPILEIEEKN